MRIAAGVTALALAAFGASAQPPAPPLESVTVSAGKPSPEAIQNYVETRSGRTTILERTATWHLKICPHTEGLGDKYAAYITRRIRAVAGAVGAPADPDPACHPNIEIVFTTTPQALIDNLRQTDPIYLGYHQTGAEGDALAKVNHPIQAWYTTLVESSNRHLALGYDGGGTIDVGKCPVTGAIAIKREGHEISIPCSAPGAAKGGRPRDGQNSSFFNVLILAEPDKLYDYEVGALADYIALIALTQPDSLDRCAGLLSISNLLARDCGASPGHITDSDLAYLRALYSLPGGDFLVTQREYIKRQMAKALDRGG
jgi:hypothetical protein